MDKITKLSQAIRLGSTFRPQSFHSFYSTGGKSCAIGAAYEALFNETPPLPPNDGDVGFRVMKRLGIEVGLHEDNIITRIIDMNDHQEMTREAIADQLEKEGL